MVQSRSRVEEAIGRVSLWRGQEVRFSSLSGGLTNTNYLVEAGDARYVMRIPGSSTELLAIDRVNEVENTRAAATTGIGPKVLEHLPELQVMVLEFIPGATMNAPRLHSEAMARRMAASFKRLHAAPRFRQDFNMFRLIESYLAIVAEHQVTIPPDYCARLPLVAEIERAVSVGALPAVSCHNDLLCENFIDDGRWLRIVDYELSGNNDACFDLGNTAQEAGFGDDLRAVLCEAYFGTLDPQQLARMNLFALMSDIGWTLWGAIQARISTLDFDFTEYYLTRWQRAIELMETERLKGWLRQAVEPSASLASTPARDAP
jgi:thiamine kinase-like enzyme